MKALKSAKNDKFLTGMFRNFNKKNRTAKARFHKIKY